MLPANLKAADFANYPAGARAIAVAHLSVLQQLPLSFAPSLLSEWIEYQNKFPAERAAIDHEVATLSELTPAQLNDWFHGFAQCRVSAELERFDWVSQPAHFVEQLSAYLWSTHQLDAFRAAAIAYGDRLHASATPELPVPRLGIAIIGQGVATSDATLFANLRQHGTYFGHVKPDNGVQLLLNAAAARAQQHPLAYGHWYIDGGAAADHSPALTSVSYQALAPARNALLKNIQHELIKPGMGPEALHSHLAQLSPGDIGMSGDALLDRFQVKLLTEGSGTQIFSTTFAQWAAREALRRAQALTLVVRFAPRQRQRPMNELLATSDAAPEIDPEGSLIDADMAAYYTWINQQRLPGSDRSAFLVWFEGHSQAIAIGPTLPRGAESSSPIDLAALLSLALA